MPPTPVAADEDCAATVELIERSITIGDGTLYAWDSTAGNPIDGLSGWPDLRNNDVDKGHGDGAVGQHDFYGTRVAKFAISIGPVPGDSGSVATLKPVLWQRWLTLRDAWAKTADGTDLTLEYVESGFVAQYLGRPNGATLDQSMWRTGMPVLRALLAWRSPDPTEY